MPARAAGIRACQWKQTTSACMDLRAGLFAKLQI